MVLLGRLVVAFRFTGGTSSASVPRPSPTLLLNLKAVIRTMTTTDPVSSSGKGLVLGFFDKEGGQFELTETAKKFDANTKGRFSEQLSLVVKNVTADGSPLKKKSSFKFFGLDNDFFCVDAINLGKVGQGYDEQEQVNAKKESVRAAISAGCIALRDLGYKTIEVDACGEPEAAAEGSSLGLYAFDELKKPASRKKEVDVSLASFDTSNKAEWARGSVKAEAQNVARRLMDSPANHMTPTIFSENIKKLFAGKDNVQVFARDKKWAEEKEMGSYLSVARGSDEPPVFMEVHYKGGPKDQKPIALVGKGITFDSGGISLKPPPDMDKMRADMGGAACVMGTLYAAVNLKIPINLIALTPMTENMPSAHATKPGDVVTAMNGKTIQIDNTDAEGRLVLADALCYAHTFDPRVILDMATLTGAMLISLGPCAAGVFTTSTPLFDLLHEAGKETGDRMWRLPLFELHTKIMTDCMLADVNNIGTTRMAGSSTAAAFLKEFVTLNRWVHLDIAGVMENKDEVPYLGKGMAGRPVRTILEFIQTLSTRD